MVRPLDPGKCLARRCSEHIDLHQQLISLDPHLTGEETRAQSGNVTYLKALELIRWPQDFPFPCSPPFF